MHEEDEVGLYLEDPTHAKKGIEIRIGVQRKLVHSYAMELEKVTNHLRQRIPKSDLQLGAKDDNLV